jgi:geranylgeranyl pyrophosphate synthase
MPGNSGKEPDLPVSEENRFFWDGCLWLNLKRWMMFETTLTLIVPMDQQTRDDIRQKVDHYFSLKMAIPPVSYHAIADYALTLVERYKWNRSYKAFVMICCGNAIWRSVVGTIPFNRRMLLLPQCLKNSHMCKASTDELGLLCSECGNCNISGFLREAENLGYITVVTEGTTIARKLVESGKVDAIIGVGCMEVLQKMFDAVHKYSLPAIGVPLLSCGCVDTTADSEWIKAEIRHFDEHSGFRLLNLNNLNDKTAALFTEAQIHQLLNLSDSVTDKLVKDILLAGGKRIRPLLTVLAYEAFSIQPDQEVLRSLAMSVECFHKASLIHDDIEDNDSSRYGKETLHTRYGIPVAINIGDLLIGEGYRLIAECNLSPHITKDCLKVISQGHKALSVGQGTELMARLNGEILTVKDILAIFENKTAAAFKVSLLVGAIAAGADEKNQKLLDQFSYLIGLAYQLKDDLEDFTVKDGALSFENPSVLLAMLAEKVNEHDRLIMQEALLQSNAENFQSLIETYSIRELITDLLKEQLQKIDLCLGVFQNIKLKLALHEIVGKTFRDYI